jgi:hypothetical protein
LAERAYEGIDHVVIRATAAESLHDLLHNRLRLPVTWPLQRASFATFGWIGVGNTNLEIWAATDNSDLPTDCSLPLFHQIALEPRNTLAETISCIQGSGLACKAPRHYASTDEHGVIRTNFTNSVILDVSSDTCCVFICEWGVEAPIAPWKRGLTTPQRRVEERAALDAFGGGLLGMVGLKKIELMSPDVPTATKRWRRLSGASGQSIMVTDDIELSLVLGNQNRIQSLTFTVRDLELARRLLAEDDLLEAGTQDEVLLSRQAAGGLAIRLIETERAGHEVAFR